MNHQFYPQVFVNDNNNDNINNMNENTPRIEIVNPVNIPKSTYEPSTPAPTPFRPIPTPLPPYPSLPPQYFPSPTPTVYPVQTYPTITPYHPTYRLPPTPLVRERRLAPIDFFDHSFEETLARLQHYYNRVILKCIDLFTTAQINEYQRITGSKRLTRDVVMEMYHLVVAKREEALQLTKMWKSLIGSTIEFFKNYPITHYENPFLYEPTPPITFPNEISSFQQPSTSSNLNNSHQTYYIMRPNQPIPEQEIKREEEQPALPVTVRIEGKRKWTPGNGRYIKKSKRAANAEEPTRKGTE
ncbi:uncharacterized protein [Onthophagus taurus]|uniref:uncharacterized protein n=1 Tax=Onthophagus taurus TaxID=166361 RepID=UPI000C1FF2FF|nr:uncharacterized protein LOC111425391 [Onthophagus taurus]